MRKRVVANGISALLILLSSTVAMAQGNVDVELSTNNIGNIFGTDESVVAKISIKNTDATSKNVNITWQAINQDGNVVEDSGTASISVGGNVSQDVQIDVDCGTYGLYKLETVTSWDGGSASDTLKFSKILSSGKGERNSDFGFASHVWRYGRPVESVELMQKAGAGGWSDGITWVKAETKKGTLALNPANEAVFKASKYNTGNMMVIGYGNPDYIKRYDNSGNEISVTEVYPPITDEELLAFGEYCAFIARETKGNVDRFQIWNEWELEATNPERLDATYYVKVLKTAYQAIKAVNQDAEIVGMGGAIITSTGDFDKAALEAGVLNYCDALSIHVYDYHRTPYFPNKRVLDDIKARVDLYRSYMGEKKIPIYISETGWSTTTTKESILHTPYTEKEQAENLVKSFVTMKAYDLADEMYWYDFQDDGEDEAEREHRFGVVTSRYDEDGELVAKPAYVASAAMNKIMSGGIHKIDDDRFQSYTETQKVLSIWGDYERIDANVVGIYPFERNNVKSEMGKHVSVLWSKDQKQFKISTGTKTIDCYDMYGNCETLSSENGIYNISLNNEIIYLSGDFEFFNINDQSVKIDEVSYDSAKNMLTVKGTTEGMSNFYIELCENNAVVQKEFCGVKQDGSFERIINVSKDGTYTLNAGKDDIADYGKWETPISVVKTETEKRGSQFGGVVVSGEGNNIRISGQLQNISTDEAVSVIVVPGGKPVTQENVLYLNQVNVTQEGVFTDEIIIPNQIKIVDIYVGANYADKQASGYSYDICRVISFGLNELNDSIIASAIVENLTDSEKEHTIIIAQYGEKEELVGISYQEYDVQPDLEERQTLTFPIPKKTKAKKAKAFIWDSLGNLTPLFEDVEIEL